MTADPNWTPLLTTPTFPEYVSGHSTFSARGGGGASTRSSATRQLHADSIACRASRARTPASSRRPRRPARAGSTAASTSSSQPRRPDRRHGAGRLRPADLLHQHATAPPTINAGQRAAQRRQQHRTSPSRARRPTTSPAWPAGSPGRWRALRSAVVRRHHGRLLVPRPRSPWTARRTGGTRSTSRPTDVAGNVAPRGVHLHAGHQAPSLTLTSPTERRARPGAGAALTGTVPTSGPAGRWP